MPLTLQPTSKNRLIVLIPDSLEVNTQLAHKIYWIALRERYNVLYLAQQAGKQDALAVERSMATLVAATAGSTVVVDWQPVRPADWIKAVRAAYRPGDVIVCHADHTARMGLFRSVLMTDYAQSVLSAHTRIVSGFPSPRTSRPAGWYMEALSWGGFLAILVVFTGLQFLFRGLSAGLPGKILMTLTAGMELGSMYAWNRYLGL